MTLLAGRYRLDQLIARGGMATVHQADDEVLRRPVAVKTPTPDRATDTAFRKAVRHEAVAAASLSHPNIARLFDYGEAEWQGVLQPFLVMELVAGTTVAAHLAEHGPMEWREAAEICAGVAAGLTAAHHKELVHCDVKPSNIMMSPGKVKILDFGVSARSGQRPADPYGRVWGTPAYLAPEQMHGQPATPASDMYALGLVLHACLTGRQPWPGKGAYQVLTARACKPVPQLPDVTKVPEALIRIHRTCLDRSPKKRPSAHQVARLLTDVVNGRPHLRQATVRRNLETLTARLTPWALSRDRVPETR
ncbi:serine/threonine-protein kinase [Actinoplanes sp. NPDC026619]|uniref:serine/threonine-protein kinase n=1 Tax=Actinoplanes sp. NPDC026619 TaxID=3155798 RepID=UPI0033F3C8CB